jgi:hypothetical protein
MTGAVAVLMLGLVALPAWSANVKDVRVGRHPEFTRIVFELDEQAGYRVKRGDRDLVVTVDAATEGWSLAANGSIESVKIEKDVTQSVANIRLRETGLRLHEMILANPPRIVLDLRSEKPVARAATPAPKPTPKPSAAPPAPKPTPKPAVAPPAPKPTPKPAAAPPAPKPAPKPAAAPPAPKPVARAAPVPEPDPSLEDEFAEPVPSFVKPVRRETTPPKPAESPASARATAPAPKPVKPVVAPKPTKREADSSAGLLRDPKILGGAAVVAIVLIALVVVVLRRRRSIPKDLDVMAIAEDSDGAGTASAEGFSMDDLSSGSTAAAQTDDDDFFGDLDSPTTETTPPVATAAAAATGGSIFDDDEDSASVAADTQGEAMMEQDFSDVQADSSAAASPSPAVADIGRIVQDLQARVSALEGKLEEANEARERLERQAAAQSEEMRVQRAAIARTQRALRSMSRGDEDKATEPALRDAETQMKTRVNG